MWYRMLVYGTYNEQRSELFKQTHIKPTPPPIKYDETSLIR
jgi:hypothetical protein